MAENGDHEGVELVEDRLQTEDPTTVLAHLSDGLSKLVVASRGPASSEPTTPSESPASLDSGLRGWLTEALSSSNTNPKVYAKILVTNAAAGSIIGKGGGSINDFQAKTYARIQLSKSLEFYPGTQERTLLVTGRLKQVIAALSLILEKLLREGVAPLTPKSRAAAVQQQQEQQQQDEPATDAGSEEPTSQRLLLKLLVPQPLCGIIIGKNGVTIRQYAADTGTVISPFSSLLSTNIACGHALQVLKQSEDPKFAQFAELPAEGSSAGAHLHGLYRAAGTGWLPGSYPAGQQVPFHTQGGDAYTQVSVLLVEEQSMMLFGRDGSGSMDVQQVTGVRVCNEPSGELPTGQRLRKVTLAGSVDAVQYAQWLLGQRLAAAMHAAALHMGSGSPPGLAHGFYGYTMPAFPAAAAPGAAAARMLPHHPRMAPAGPVYLHPGHLPQAPNGAAYFARPVPLHLGGSGAELGVECD
eukprot:scaffold27.g6024.t1